MLVVLLGVAWGCAPTAVEVGRARAAYDDAEIEQAGRILEATVEGLGCQTARVQTSVLLELYRLDGLVALSRMNEKAAVYATIRAATVDPDAPPPPEYGPELAELYATWSDRLRNATASLSVDGGGTVYVDGQPITHGGRRTVLQGEHLIQVDSGTAVGSDVRDVTGDLVVRTGLPAPIGVSGPAPMPVPRPVPGVRPTPPVDPVPSERSRPMALWAAGGAVAGVGVVLLGVATYQDEVAFPKRQFPDIASVDRAASRIRATYGVGYALTAVGGGLLVTNAVGLPTSVGVRLRW